MTGDGGNAFPRQSGTTEMGGATGMSLRDYFAARTLHAIVSGLRWSSKVQTPDQTLKAIVRDCYITADAMLAERDK